VDLPQPEPDALDTKLLRMSPEPQSMMPALRNYMGVIEEMEAIHKRRKRDMDVPERRRWSTPILPRYQEGGDTAASLPPAPLNTSAFPQGFVSHGEEIAGSIPVPAGSILANGWITPDGGVIPADTTPLPVAQGKPTPPQMPDIPPGYQNTGTGWIGPNGEWI